MGEKWVKVLARLHGYCLNLVMNKKPIISPANSRRSFLKMSGLALLSPWVPKGSIPSRKECFRLPEREDFLIKDAYILSMDNEIGDLESGDILIKQGKIVQVGSALQNNGARIIEGKGKIAMPGFVETHWHIWTSLLRSMAIATSGKGYFETTRSFGPEFTPEDMYWATMLAGLEAIYSGMTTLHDWSHNVRGKAYSEASLGALKELGVRGRYSAGAASGQDGEDMVDLALLQHLKENWGNYDAGGLLHLGMAWRGIGGHPGIDSKAKVGLKELEFARDLGIPVSVHASAPEILSRLLEEHLLGPDMQLVHGMGASQEEINAVVDKGASLSISPFSEMRIGYGFPPIIEAIKANARVGLSVDTTTLTGNADMFAIMKAMLNLATALEKDEFVTGPRRMLEMATIEGARTLGLDDLIGSITEGKRADLILIDVRSPNLGYLTHPPSLVVEAAQPSNISSVLVDGRLLRHEGDFLGLNEGEIYGKCQLALSRLKQKVES